MKLRRLWRRLRRVPREVIDRTGWSARRFRRALVAAAPVPGASHHVLIAPPGAGNIGDQAMVEAFVAAADRPVIVVTRNPDDFVLPEDLSGNVRLAALPNLLYGDGAGHYADVRELGALLNGAATVSIVGADIMDGVYVLRPSLRRASLAEAAASRGFDTTVVGFSWNGAAPRPAWAALRRAGASGVRLMLRDPASAARVRDAGIEGVVETADIVFTDDRILRPSSPLRDLPRPYALVNASGLIARKVDQVPEYAAVADWLRARGLHVVLLPHVVRSSADDLAACRAVFEATGPQGVTLVEETLAPSVIRALAADASLAITGRMHLAVMSLSRGTPAITLASQGKVEGLMRLFEWPELCVTPRAGMSETIVSVAETALDGQGPRDLVSRGAERARAAARANIERIGALGDVSTSRRAVNEQGAPAWATRSDASAG
ncbi:polysaccharide pyruvyl transferase family protein [Microbacterium sp. NPDC019599]|uniref:polysaccharide pyruvyl transferase family protein n=1 Tax=Microbacterium sp. NPDC019599 TaxID=3154690 RepID=UPI0033F77986